LLSKELKSTIPLKSLLSFGSFYFDGSLVIGVLYA
jgi:hypothetical protein